MSPAHPKPAPRKKVRRWKTPRCTFGKGRCKRPQAVDSMCRSHARQEADRLWSLEIRSKGECEAKGWWVNEKATDFSVTSSGRLSSTTPTYESPRQDTTVRCGGVLQAAHGFPRTYGRTRWVPLNGFCICAGHHRWFTSHHLEWTQFMIERLGETVYEEMRQLALSR